MSRSAFKFETQVLPGGKLELQVPLPAGSRVEVVVLTEEADDFRDLLEAAQSSTDFWDNPQDDAEWS